VRRSIAIALLGAWVLAACTTLSVRPQEPRVSVDSVRLAGIGLLRQDIELMLLVENPNPFALPIRDLAFVATLGDERVASGSSSSAVNIPARGQARLPVMITTRLSRTLRGLGRQLGQHGLDLTYRVTGSVKLANWPARLPFDADGSLQDTIEDRTRP